MFQTSAMPPIENETAFYICIDYLHFPVVPINTEPPKNSTLVRAKHEAISNLKAFNVNFAVLLFLAGFNWHESYSTILDVIRESNFHAKLFSSQISFYQKVHEITISIVCREWSRN